MDNITNLRGLNFSFHILILLLLFYTFYGCNDAESKNPQDSYISFISDLEKMDNNSELVLFENDQYSIKSNKSTSGTFLYHLEYKKDRVNANITYQNRSCILRVCPDNCTKCYCSLGSGVKGDCSCYIINCGFLTVRSHSSNPMRDIQIPKNIFTDLYDRIAEASFKDGLIDIAKSEKFGLLIQANVKNNKILNYKFSENGKEIGMRRVGNSYNEYFYCPEDIRIWGCISIPCPEDVMCLPQEPVCYPDFEFKFLF